MSRGLVDTSVFIARENGRSLRIDSLPNEIAVSVITLAEIRAGVLAAADVETRDRRLATLVQVLTLEPIPIDSSVAESWAKLRLLLHDSGQRMRVNDSWIAATAMSLDVPLVTQDNDYVEITGLTVVKV